MASEGKNRGQVKQANDEKIQQIISLHRGVLTRTATKAGCSVPFVRQVVVLRERNSAKVWQAFQDAVEEIKKEQEERIQEREANELKISKIFQALA